MMNNPPRRETAKIYRFPPRMRIALSDAQHLERATVSRPFPVGDPGSGWYHEAAIQDERRERKP